MDIQEGIYGLPQADILANQQLTNHLFIAGYAPVPLKPGVWKHATRDIHFFLCVDDFLIKYANKIDAEHLLQTLESRNIISTDWQDQLYCKVTLD